MHKKLLVVGHQDKLAANEADGLLAPTAAWFLAGGRCPGDGTSGIREAYASSATAMSISTSQMGIDQARPANAVVAAMAVAA